jgi:hypothetical protein
MSASPRYIDAPSVVSATRRAKRRNEQILQAARGLAEDHQKEARQASQLCTCCFYVVPVRIAGAALTTVPCGLCQTPCTFASTAVDRLCVECAKGHELCKRCGADIELREQRSLETLDRGQG